MPVESKLDFKTLNANKKIRTKNYWRNRLSGFEFNSYFDQGPEKEAHGQLVHSISAPRSTIKALNNVAQSDRAKHVVLLAALGVLIQKSSSYSDIAVVTSVYKRDDRPGSSNVVLPVRFEKYNAELSFTRLLTVLRDKLLKDLEHADYPIEKILDKRYDELKQTNVIGMHLTGLQASPLQAPMSFDMIFGFSSDLDNLRLSIEYDHARHNLAYVAQIGQLYFSLLEKLILQREKALSQIEIISEIDKHKIINEFNQTKKEFPSDKTIMDLFESRATECPNSIAVRFEQEQLTYKKLDERSDQIASYLAERFDKKGAVIGVYLERSLELMTVLYGILKSGNVYLPLSRRYPIDRTRYSLRNSEAKAVFVMQQDLTLFADEFECIMEGDISASASAHVNHSDPEQLAYIIYTSGSTGRPKGVQIKHRSIVNRLNWMQNEYRLEAGDTVLQKTPIVFDVSIWELFWWSISGAKLVLAQPGVESDPKALCHIIREEKVSILHFVPSMLTALLQYLKDSDDYGSLNSIKHLFASGEALKAEDAQFFLRKCPSARLHNLYGPTEATVDVSFHEVLPSREYDRVPIGRPIDNTQLYIFSAEIQLQPIGISGELYIGGENLSVGYLNQEELTSEKFVTNPLNDDSLLYKTGDLAKWLPDGSIEFLGRMDHQLKIRGNRIELGEIEHMVNAIDKVRNAVALPKMAKSGSHQLLCFFVAEVPLSKDALTNHLISRLPDYMIPADFIQIDEIPVTVNGKVDRKTLLSYKKIESEAYTGPETGLEKKLTVHWKAVLEVDRISITESFFRRGGDSILAVRLIGAINQALTLDLSVHDLYENNTIQALASFIEISEPEPGRKKYEQVEAELAAFDLSYKHKIEDVNIEVVYPMSDIEKSMCYVSQSRPEDILYFEQLMVPVTYEMLDLTILQKALNLLIEKHEVLRTGFDLSEFAHIVYKDLPTKIKFHDLSSLDAQDQKSTIKSNLEKSRQQHFDLGSAPLWRIILYKLSDHHHELLFEYHHALLDGWSYASLLTELTNTYGELLRDESFKLVPLKSNFKDVITVELVSKNDQEAIDFWKVQLKDFKKLSLEVGDGDKTFQSVREAYPTQLLKDLDQAARLKNTTVKTILLSAYLYSLKVITGESDLLVGLVTFNRPLKEDGDKVLGCFLNTIPFRFKLPAGISWTALIQLVDKKLLELKRFEHLSLFEINRITGEQTFGGNPLFDTQFNYVNWHVEEGMRLEKRVNTEPDRLDFDVFLRGNTFFDINYNVNSERILSMHEYSSPFMTPEVYAFYEKVFLSALSKVIQTPDGILDSKELYWHDEIEDVYNKLDDADNTKNLENIELPFHLEKLWNHSTDAIGNHINRNLPLTIDLEGDLNITNLQKAFHEVIDKYEVLHSQITLVDGKLLQRTLPDNEFQLDLTVIRQSQEKTDDLLEKMLNKPFKYNQPLVRAALLQTSDNRYKLMMVFHRIIADPRSIQLFSNELLYSYQALNNGKDKKNERGIKSYFRYSLWQQKTLPRLSPYALSYWSEQLGGSLKIVELPKDHSSEEISEGNRTASVPISMEPSLFKALLRYEETTRISLDVILMACFKVLLNKYTGQEEVLIGRTTDNRTKQGLKELIGPISDITLVRSFIPQDINFDEYISTLDEIYTDAVKFCVIPHETLMHKLGLDNSVSGNGPKINILYHFEDHDRESCAINDLSVEIIQPYRDDREYDLGLLLNRSDSGVSGEMIYNPAHFDHSGIQQMVRRFYELAANLLSSPQDKLSQQELIPQNEKDQILNEFNDTNAAYPLDQTIVSLFEQQVENTPENVAIRYGTKVLSYRQTSELSNQIAHYLIGKGVKRSDLVGIMLERNEYMIPVLFGALKAGAAYLPIDPTYPNERKKIIIEDAGINTLISIDSFPKEPSIGVAQVLNLKDMLQEIQSLPISSPVVQLDGHDLAYVIYTSGSTGRPKGVMIEHHSVINRLTWMQNKYPINEQDVLLQKTPIVFDVSVWELFWWSFTGASVSLLKPNEEKDADAIIKTIKDHEVTTIHFVPSMLSIFMAVTDNGFDYMALKSLRQVFASGEALKSDYVRAFGDSIHKHCQTRLINLYGPTEATVDVSYYECDFTLPIGRIPIGKPIDNLKLYVLGGDDNILPVGVKGELCISGVGLARGYFNNKALTDEKFVIHPFSPGERMYKTGDVARWLPDGNIEFIGRKDDQVKIRGFRIELGDIEHQLLEHPLVRQTVVVVKTYQEDAHLVAYYISEVEINPDDLRNHLLEQLPEHMVPYHYVFLEALPMTVNGKIDRKALPAPELTLSNDYVGPSSETEIRLVRIWSEILKLDKDMISINKSFFELGGHSLNTIAMANKIYKTFNMKLTLQEIFDKATIEQIGEHLDACLWLKEKPSSDRVDKVTIKI